ncbi:MAG: DNA polymerase Y family protein [Hyphomicrobiaceae bacterium]
MSPQQVPHSQPFALVESGSRGVCITAVNPSAAASGIHAGQMLADARAVLPGLLTCAAEPERDTRALQQLALWLGRYGPNRNVDGADGLWVDITGVAHLFGGEAALARDCVTRFKRAGFQALVAIADTRSGAFALGRYGRMTEQVAISAPGGVRTALAELPVEGLQLTGELVLLLRRLGLKRIGQFYDLPRVALARRFRAAAPKTIKRRKRHRGFVKPAATYNGWAETLIMRLDQALGDLREPARGIVEPPVYRVQRAYAEPLISHDGVLAALDDLAAQLCATLEARDEGARALAIAFYRADGTVANVTVRTSRPARAAGHIAELFEARLENLDVGLGLDAVVLEALHTERLVRVQTGLAGSAICDGVNDRRNDNMTDGTGVLIDRLSNRLGAAAVFHLEEVASHIPERAERRVAALHGGNSLAAPAVFMSKPPRPAFLLEPAEPINVLAEVPDGPPVRFTWRRVTRRVARAEGPERIAPEWWHLIGENIVVGGDTAHEDSEDRGLGPVVRTPKPAWRIRDYYRIEDEHGGVYWVYRAGIYPGVDPVAAPSAKPDTEPDTQANRGRDAARPANKAAHATARDVEKAVPPLLATPTWYLQGLF